MDNKDLIVFQGENLKITKEQYDTFVTSISTQSPTKEEIQLHLWYCDSKNVNPLDKLIYFTKRQGRYTPITSIDFMRLRAESSNSYAGSDDAEFYYKKDEEKKIVTAIDSAKVTVWKMVGGQRCAFSATARWSEYAPLNINDKSAFMWKKMPHTMLAKCAEALALRKAFPGQLHGLYASEEMAQDGRYINAVDVEVIAESAKEEAGNYGNDNQDNKPSTEEVLPSGVDKGVDEEFSMAEEAKKLANGFTPKELNDASKIIEIKNGTNFTIVQIKKILKTLDESQKYTVEQIKQMLGEQNVES